MRPVRPARLPPLARPRPRPGAEVPRLARHADPAVSRHARPDLRHRGRPRRGRRRLVRAGRSSPSSRPSPSPRCSTGSSNTWSGSAAGSASVPKRRAKYQVVAALVNLTGPAQPDTLEMALPGLASPGLHFSAAVRTLRDEDAAATLDQIAAGATSRCLLCWISLMRGGGKPGIIERWKQVASQEPNNQHRATYGAIVTVFAELTDCAALWKSGLEGWDMRESTIVAEWKAEARAEGMAEGIAEGMSQGDSRGHRRGQTQALLSFWDRSSVHRSPPTWSRPSRHKPTSMSCRAGSGPRSRPRRSMPSSAPSHGREDRGC